MLIYIKLIINVGMMDSNWSINAGLFHVYCIDDENKRNIGLRFDYFF